MKGLLALGRRLIAERHESEPATFGLVTPAGSLVGAESGLTCRPTGAIIPAPVRLSGDHWLRVA
jgi:hypothetical protein